MKSFCVDRMAAGLVLLVLFAVNSSAATLEAKPVVLPETVFYEGKWSHGNREFAVWLLIESSPAGPSSVRGEITIDESFMNFKDGQRVAIRGSYYPAKGKLAARFSGGSKYDFQIDGQFKLDSNSIAAGVRINSLDVTDSFTTSVGDISCQRRMSKTEDGLPTLPSVEGLREDAARALMASIGIKDIYTVWEKEEVTTANAGMVKHQDPPAGLKIQRLDLIGPVALTVYGDPERVQVPDLSGLKSRQEISATLEAVELVASFAPESVAPEGLLVKEFQFVSQDHPAGELLKKNSSVSVKIREPAMPESTVMGEGVYLITSATIPQGKDNKYSLKMHWKPVADDRADVTFGLPGDQDVGELKKSGLDPTTTLTAHREGGQYVIASAELESWIERLLRAVASQENPRVHRAKCVLIPRQGDFDITFTLDFSSTFDGEEQRYNLGDNKLFAKRQ